MPSEYERIFMFIMCKQFASNRIGTKQWLNRYYINYMRLLITTIIVLAKSANLQSEKHSVFVHLKWIKRCNM